MSTPIKQKTRISLEDKLKLIEDSIFAIKHTLELNWQNIMWCLNYKAKVSINVLFVTKIYHIASIHEGKKPFEVKLVKGLKK